MNKHAVNSGLLVKIIDNNVLACLVVTVNTKHLHFHLNRDNHELKCVLNWLGLASIKIKITEKQTKQLSVQCDLFYLSQLL